MSKQLGQLFIINSNLIYKGPNNCIYSFMGSQGANFNPKKNSSDGLELYWVQGGPIVTLARLFIFLFTPYSNSQNWPKTWPKIMAEIQA